MKKQKFDIEQFLLDTFWDLPVSKKYAAADKKFKAVYKALSNTLNNQQKKLLMQYDDLHCYLSCIYMKQTLFHMLWVL